MAMSAIGALSVVTFDAELAREYQPKWHLVRATNAPDNMTWRRYQDQRQVRWEFTVNSNRDKVETVAIKLRTDGVPHRITSSFGMASGKYIRSSKRVVVVGNVFDAQVTLQFKIF